MRGCARCLQVAVMAGLDAVLEALALDLAAALPERVVTRNFRPLSQRTRQEMAAGVVCVVCKGERGYANYRGREADLGTLEVVIIGQFEAQPSPGEKLAPVEVEAGEFALAEEVKGFLRGPWRAPVRDVVAHGFVQSGQLDAPYGWVVFECEVRA